MEFWDGVGGFFASFEPKDWVTAALAVLAIAVSVFTASQTWRYHPKPLLMVDSAVFALSHEPAMAGFPRAPMVRVSMTNRGNGPAHAVRIEVTGAEWHSEYREIPILGPGESETWWVTLSQTVETTDARNMPVRRLSHPDVKPEDVRVWRRWRQSPVMRWDRRRRVRVEPVERS